MFKLIGCASPIFRASIGVLLFFSGQLYAFKTPETNPKVQQIDTLIASFPGLIRSDIHKAQQVIAQINQLSATENYRHGIIEGTFDNCWLQYHIGNIDRCIISLDSAIKHIPQLYHDPGAIKFNILKGQCYVKKTQYSLAVQEFSAALKIAEQNHDEASKAGVLLSTGWAYMEDNKFNEAISFFMEILKIKASNQYLNKATVFNNIASCYNSLTNYKEAATYALQGVKEARTTNSLVDLANGLNILAGAVYKQGNTKQALAYLSEASKVREKVGDPAMLASDYLELADMYRNNHQRTLATAYTQKAVTISEKNKINLKLVTAYEALANDLNDAGNYKQATVYYKKLLIYKDSANNIANNKAMSELLVKYNTQKKTTENLQLKHDNLTARLKLADKQRLLILTVAIAVLIVVVSVFGYVYNRNQYNNRLVIQQVTEQKNRMLAILQTEESERTRIAADLHDGVCQMLAAISIQLKKPDQPITVAQDLLEQATAEVRSVSHQMTPELLKHLGLVKAMENSLERLNNSDMGITFHFFDMVEIAEIDELLQVMIYRAFQELINNTTKHARATEVNVHLTLDEGNMLLMIEDNGIGFNTQNNYEGLGLKSLANRVKAFNGILTIDSTPAQGTTVIIKFDEPVIT